MSQQATQGIESAIVLAPADSLTEGWDSSLEAAFRASLRELLAVPKERLLVVNVDVRGAVCLGLAAPERLQPWRDRILDELPRFDIDALDRLEQYAKALMHAQVKYTLARKSPADIRALTEAARCRYQVLLNDARALAARGLIAAEQLARFTGCRRRVDRALALSALVDGLKAAWPRIEGKTALTLSELEQADEQAVQLMFALAHQKKPLKELAKIAELRQRAFTVFATAYNQVRRAIRYLCDDEREAERIIPSLYPRKRAAAKAQSTAVGVAPEAQTSRQPTAAPSLQQSQSVASSIQFVVTPVAMAPAGFGEPATASAATPFGATSRPLDGPVPQRPSSSDPPPEVAVKPSKSKPRRRPTKRARFMRALGRPAR